MVQYTVLCNRHKYYRRNIEITYDVVFERLHGAGEMTPLVFFSFSYFFVLNVSFRYR